MKHGSCQDSSSNREPMLFKSVHIFCSPRMISAKRFIFWGQGFCFHGAWTSCLVRNAQGSVLIWIPSMRNISSAWVLRHPLLYQLISQVGTLRLSLGVVFRLELKSLNFWRILILLQICLETAKPQAAREKQSCVLSQCTKELRKIFTAACCGGKGLGGGERKHVRCAGRWAAGPGRPGPCLCLESEVDNACGLPS